MNSTIGKKLFYALAVAGLAAGCSTVNVDSVTQTVTKKASSDSVTTVRFNGEDISGMTTGDIQVTGTTQPVISADVQIRRLVVRNQESSSGDYIVSINKSGGIAKLSASYTGDDWENVKANNCELTFDRNLKTDVQTTTGSIEVTDMRAPVIAEATTGSLTVESALGCTLTTTTGSIEYTLLKDSTADTASIRITAKATTGSITITIPQGKTAYCDLKVTTGSITLPDGTEDGKSVKRGINGGTLSGAKCLITCEATTGSISIEEQ